MSGYEHDDGNGVCEGCAEGLGIVPCDEHPYVPDPSPLRASMREHFDRAMEHLRGRGEDVDALLARAGANLTHWKGREAPFPTEALIESERELPQ